MPSGTGQGTEAYEWNTETEWSNGTFSDTTTDGAGTLTLQPLTSVTFDYSLDAVDEPGSADTTASVEISDTSTGTVLASDSISESGTSNTVTGSFNIDVATHPDLSFRAEVVVDSSSSSASASISGPVNGSNTTLVSASASTETTVTDTRDEVYNYAVSGSWTSPDYTFSEVTTATQVSWSGVTLPNSGDDITATVENQDGSNTVSVSVTSGSGSALVAIPPDDVYRVVLDITSVSDDTTPEIGSIGLETHTPTSGHTVVDTRSTEVDLSWDEVSVSDGYEVYYSTSTPVTDSDSLGFDTTDPTVTSGTVTGLSQGTTYYFNVRTQYSGE